MSKSISLLVVFKRGLHFYITAGLFLFPFSMPINADWAELSRFQVVVEVNVTDTKADIGVRLSANSLAAIADIPEAMQVCPPVLPEKGRVGCFSRWLLRMTDEQAQLMPGSMPPVAVFSEEGKERVWETALVYPMPHKLETLTLASAVFAVPVNGKLAIGLVVTHQGVPVSDLTAFEHPLTLYLDWKDPWATHFDDSSRVRRHTAPRSWIYLEPLEARHEILIRLSDVRGWLPDSLKDELNSSSDLSSSLRQKLIEALGTQFLQRNPMVLDGKQVLPQLDRIEFVSFNRQGIVPIADGSRLDANSALLGVVLAYFVDKPVRSLRLTWDFSGASHVAPTSRSFSILQGMESFDSDVTIEQPLLSWSSDEMLEPPTADKDDDAALAGKEDQGLSEMDRVKTILASLLHNAYRGFQLREENAVYDRLAKSLDGNLLDEIFLQQRKALLKQTRGLGGEGRVSRVELLDLQLQNKRHFPPRYDMTARWSVDGVVSHWGHAHNRRNLYEAKLMLVRQGGDWRITELAFLDGRRLVAGDSR